MKLNLTKYWMPITSFCLCLILMSCNKEQYNYLEKTKTAEEIIDTENRVEKAFYMCVGLFSNKTQARQESSALYRSQELISVQIWPRRGQEYWLYICWLQEDRPDNLLSQEIWNFKRLNRDSIAVHMYDVPNKDMYSKDWRKKDPLRDLKPNDLSEESKCIAYLTRIDKDRFVLKGDICARELSDQIKHIEISGILNPAGIVLYNRMLDSDKDEKFKYEQGLQFERQPKIFPKYLDED